MINNSLNVTALTNSLTAPVSDSQSKLNEVIHETQQVLADIIDMMIKDLENVINKAAEDKEASEEVKNLFKTQFGAVIEILKEEKASFQNADHNELKKDPKELLQILTGFGEYLEKSLQKAQDEKDAFKAHALEQKSEHVSNLKTQLAALA